MGTPVLDLMIKENVVTWPPLSVMNEVVSSKNPKILEDVEVEEVRAAFERLNQKLENRN